VIAPLIVVVVEEKKEDYPSGFNQCEGLQEIFRGFKGPKGWKILRVDFHSYLYFKFLEIIFKKI
jgi:hypothetical protein